MRQIIAHCSPIIASVHKVLLLILCSLPTQVYSSVQPLVQTLDSAQQITQSTNREGTQSQKNIDRVHDKTEQLISSYHEATENLTQLRRNNAHLQQVLAQQEIQTNSLNSQLSTVYITEKAIIPLMLKMIDTLEASIQQDLPFLREERDARIASLRAMLIDPDSQLPEKYRRVLEVYEIERAFGYTLETYQTEITLGERQKRVNILRVGRIGLYYQTPDGAKQGFWNQAERQWQPLTSKYQETIQQGILIASEQATPNLLQLPVTTTDLITTDLTTTDVTTTDVTTTDLTTTDVTTTDVTTTEKVQ